MSEDEGFDRYLRSFRPFPPSPLPQRRTSRKARRFLIFTVPVAAGILLAALLLFHTQARRIDSPATSEVVPKANSSPSSGPLTTASANAALFRNSSVKAALDGMAFPVRSTQPPAGQISALQLLGKEKDEY